MPTNNYVFNNALTPIKILNNKYNVNLYICPDPISNGSNSYTIFVPPGTPFPVYLHPDCSYMFPGRTAVLNNNTNNNTNTLSLNLHKVVNMRGCFLNSEVKSISNEILQNINNVKDFSYACTNGQSVPLALNLSFGPNITNMSYAFYNFHLRNNSISPGCGANVINMSYAYYNCKNLKGYPACGVNVIDMSFAYGMCNTKNFNKAPVCGPNVVNMAYAYYNCANLTGSSACGPNVVDMSYAYYKASLISGTANLGEKVVKASHAYDSTSITTAATCPDTVRLFDYGYASCSSLQSIGSKFLGNYIWNAYRILNSRAMSSIEGDIYINLNDNTVDNKAEFGKRMLIWDETYTANFVQNRANNHILPLNIWVPRDSAINNAYYSYRPYYNTTSVLTWTTMTNGYYNAAANIYVYYNNPHAFNYNISNSNDMSNAYCECTNLTGSPACGPNVVDMGFAYYRCNNLTGSPACGPNVVDMRYTYYSCGNLTGTPVCGPNVVNMAWAYQYCKNLTGTPVCGPNVVNMFGAYYYCNNLTGSPACGPNVANMSYAYCECTNLTGSPACGPNVVDMGFAYNNCSHLSGAPVIGDKVVKLERAYAGTNVSGNCFWNLHYDSNKHFRDFPDPACNFSYDKAFYQCHNINLYIRNKELFNIINANIFGGSGSTWTRINNNFKTYQDCNLIYIGT